MPDSDLRKPPEEDELPDCRKMIFFAMGVALLLSFVVWAHSPRTAGDPAFEDTVRKSLWTSNVIGNPNTYVLAAVRPSRSSDNVVCGRINFERVDNGGWSGYRDFYVELGVIYIVRPNSEREKAFNFYCLANTATGAAAPVVKPDD